MTSDDEESKTVLPRHPTDSNNTLEVTQWRKDMYAYLLTKGLGKTARTGRRAVYPTGVITLGDDKSRIDQKREMDREENGRLFGLLLRSVKGNTNLYETLMTKEFIDADHGSKELGAGHDAWKWLSERPLSNEQTRYKQMEAARIERELELAKGRVAPYCSAKEWDKRVQAYDKKNEACGTPYSGSKGPCCSLSTQGTVACVTQCERVRPPLTHYYRTSECGARPRVVRSTD